MPVSMLGDLPPSAYFLPSITPWAVYISVTLNLKKQGDKEMSLQCVGGHLRKGEGEWRRWRWGNMGDGLRMCIWNRTMKPVLSGTGKEVVGVVGEEMVRAIKPYII
jgi:hypothetical protein